MQVQLIWNQKTNFWHVVNAFTGETLYKSYTRVEEDKEHNPLGALEWAEAEGYIVA